MNIDPSVQLVLEQWLSISLFWVIAIVLTGQWLIMTFMWPRTPPEWAVWSKTTAFLLVVIARLVLYYPGVARFPFPVGAILNLIALILIVYFGKVYLLDTWVLGRHKRGGGGTGDHVRGYSSRYWADEDEDPTQT